MNARYGGEGTVGRMRKQDPEGFGVISSFMHRTGEWWRGEPSLVCRANNHVLSRPIGSGPSLRAGVDVQQNGSVCMAVSRSDLAREKVVMPCGRYEEPRPAMHWGAMQAPLAVAAAACLPDGQQAGSPNRPRPTVAEPLLERRSPSRGPDAFLPTKGSVIDEDVSLLVLPRGLGN